MKHLKRIWNDPVGSKLISAAILFIITTIYISIESYYKEKSFSEVLTDILNSKLDLKTILILLLVIGMLYIIYNLIFSFKYTESTKKSDIELFNTIRNNKLDQDNTINFLREFNFRGLFNLSRLDGIYDFMEACKRTDFKFVNPKLEKIKEELKNEILKFSEIVAYKTFPENGGQGVPREWEKKKPTKFKTTISNLNNTATKICEIYDKFIIKGRRELEI
jgi:hypothetical protein